ncbi:Zinc finger, CCHC domain-containing protein [Tyrophagus putrescentiae]|nr:Zinc finger, CCHC domain-containing protein [Tyrophagus putrescentiae]
MGKMRILDRTEALLPSPPFYFFTIITINSLPLKSPVQSPNAYNDFSSPCSPASPLPSPSSSPPSSLPSPSSSPSPSPSFPRHQPSSSSPMCILQSSAHSAYIAAAAAAATSSLGPLITERKQQWLDGFLTDLILKTYNHRRQSKELLDYKCDLQEAITRVLAATLCGLDGNGNGGGSGGSSSGPPLQFKIYLIGSSLTSIGSSRSDIDLCMVIYNSATGQVDDRYHNRIYAEVLLERISAILERAGLAFQSKVIRANVPILKFFDRNHIEVNLNLNKIVTVQNTMLLLWAAKNGINCAYFKSLSSYSLSLMAIFFLQNVVYPAILPPFSQLIDYVVQCTSLFQYHRGHHHNGLHVTSSVPFDAFHFIERFPAIPSPPPPPPPPALMLEDYRKAAAVAAAAIEYQQQQLLQQHLTNGNGNHNHHHHVHAPDAQHQQPQQQQQQANQLFSGSAISRVTFLDNSSQLPSLQSFPMPPPPPPPPPLPVLQQLIQQQQQQQSSSVTLVPPPKKKGKKGRKQQQQQLQVLQNGCVDELHHVGSLSSSSSSSSSVSSTTSSTSSSSSSSLSLEEMEATKHLPYYYYYYYYYYWSQFQLMQSKAVAAAAAAAAAGSHFLSSSSSSSATKSSGSLCGSSSASSSSSDNGDVISSSSSSSSSCASSLSGSLSVLSISSSSGCGGSTTTSPSSSPPSTSPNGTECTTTITNGHSVGDCGGSSSGNGSRSATLLHLESFKSTNVQSLGSLFAEFIAFYSDETVYDSVISVRTGRLMRRTDPHFARSSSTSMETFICIEEPFNHSNTSHSVHNEFMYHFIVKTFRWTRESISKLKLTMSDFV